MFENIMTSEPVKQVATTQGDYGIGLTEAVLLALTVAGIHATLKYVLHK